MEIKDSVALVTGANRGLGLAFSRALIDAGAKKVYAAARDPRSVTLSDVIPIKLDVTSAADIVRVAAECADVTLLINNAGIAGGGSLLDSNSLQTLKDELNVNVFGTLEMSKAFAPILARNGGGAIVNMASILSWLNIPGWSTYAVSKAAVWSLTNGLRNELAGQNTHVVAVHAAYLDTEMTKHVAVSKTDPKDAVRLALAAVINGQKEVMVDGLTAQVQQGLSSSVYLGIPGG